MSAQEPDPTGRTAPSGGSAARGARSRSLKLWIVSFVLFLPFYYPVLTHFLFPPPGLLPSGFIQPDMPYYAANAREHFDDGGFELRYGLPYSPSYVTPRIYFQPQTLLLAGVMRVTRVDPGVLFLLFGAVFGVICCRLALGLFEHLFTLRSLAHRLAAIGFIGGGGLLVAAGAVKWAGSGDLNDLFAFDPADGMWFLNLGRNLIFPYESYYHAVWIGATICLLRRRFAPAVALVALASVSHPFTGAQLIAVVLTWAAFERFWIRNREMPAAFVGAIAALLTLHLGYYRWYLGRSVEHSIVELQWIAGSQSWSTYEARHFIPAYALAAALVAWRIRTPARAAAVFSHPCARLLAVWAVVSFALANNEIAFRPHIQPLHFARGYIWMALYLLGAPALIAGLQWLLDRSPRPLAVAGVAAAITVLCLDNAVFLTTFHLRSRVASVQMWLEPGFRDLAHFLSRPEHAGYVLLTPPAPDQALNPLPYMLMVYTPLRAWQSHPFNTPWGAQRQQETVRLFADGAFLPVWNGMKLLVVLGARDPPPGWLTARNGRRVYANQTFAVYRLDPVLAGP